MDARTDVARLRRTYIMGRLQRAVHRLLLAQNAHEYIVARRWVNAWSSALGELKFRPAAHTSFTYSDRPSMPTHSAPVALRQ